MAVGQRLERTPALAVGTGEAMVVHQGVKTVPAAVPHVPDEGPLLEEPAVLLEEPVAQPFFNGLGRSAGSARRRPAVAVPLAADQSSP